MNKEYATEDTNLCALQPTPFRGAPCSDAAGRQVCFGEIQRFFRPYSNTTSRPYNTTSRGQYNTTIKHTPTTKTVNYTTSVATTSTTSTTTSTTPIACENASWDGVQHAQYARCVDTHGNAYQLWYDDPNSLRAKYGLAVKYGLLGVGFWNVDCLDTGCATGDEECVHATAAMWRAVREGLYGSEDGAVM